jgi:hypothetical protein
VAGAALVSALLVLLIQRFLGSGDWKWADALGDLVKLFTTTIVIVGLLEWYRRRRWQLAENEDLRSLALLANLVVSGWSSPKNIGAPDLDPTELADDLEKQMTELEKTSGNLDALYRILTKADKPELMGFLQLSQERWTLESYYAEGSRSRRLGYLSTLAEVHLPGLVERRDDPVLFTLAIALRNNVIRARAAANHADAIVREQVLLDRPQILEPFLDKHRELVAMDPVVVLARAVAYATDSIAVDDLLKSSTAIEAALDELRFANRCVGAIRNEIQWVTEALHGLKEVIRLMETDIREAANEVEALPRLGMAGPGLAPGA